MIDMMLLPKSWLTVFGIVLWPLVVGFLLRFRTFVLLWVVVLPIVVCVQMGVILR